MQFAHGIVGRNKCEWQSVKIVEQLSNEGESGWNCLINHKRQVCG